MFILY